MAWTSPVDYSTGQIITAAIWNNMLGSGGNIDETAPAKVTTAGDIVYGTGTNAIARLGIGSANQLLQVSSGGIPEWGEVVSSAISGTGSASGQVLTSTGSGTAPTWQTAAAGGKITVTASGAISGAGISVSLNSDGTVSATADNRVSSSLGTTYEATSHTSNYPMAGPVGVYNANEDAVVVFWLEDDTGVGTNYEPKTVAASISGSTLTFGSIVTIGSATLGTAYTCGIQYDPDTYKMWYMYHTATGNYNAYLAVGTVSGTTITITAGPDYTGWQETSNHDQNTCSFVYDTDTNQMIAMFGAYYTKLFLGVVSESGGTITVNTATEISAANYRNCTSACYLPDVSRLVVYSGLGGTRTIQTFSITGTTITTDQADAWTGNGTAGQYARANSLVPTTDGTKVLLMGLYVSTNQDLEWNVATITAGSPTTRAFSTSQQLSGFDSGVAYWNCTNRVGTGSSYVVQTNKSNVTSIGTWILENLDSTPTLTLNGSISTNSSTQYPTYVNTSYGNAYTAGGKIISIFDTANTNFQVASALYTPPSGTTTATEFIGISEAAISDGATGEITVISGTNTGVSGLTAGQTYFLQADGSLATTKASNNYGEVGKALSATSILVSGVGDTSVSNT